MAAEIVHLQARMDAAVDIVVDEAPPWEIPPAESYANEPIAEASTGAPEKSARPPIEFRHLADIVAENREPAWLIHNIIEREVLAILAGPRSTFKSFVAFHWLMTVRRSQSAVRIPQR